MLKSAHTSKRAGRVVPQSGGYAVFVPAPLPPTPALQLDDPRQALLAEANLALGRLDGVVGILPNPDLFVAMYVRQEAVLSSQIEGTQASLTDVLELEIDQERTTVPDAAEVVNYIAAMRHGLDRLGTLPLSLRLIREIHEQLMQGVRGEDRQPGEFRSTQNWIGPAGSTLATAVFVPPPVPDMRDALGELETFLHDTSLPALTHAALAHAQFETIHPFVDGNGRVGRLLITFLLCHRHVLSKPLLYLSHYLKQNRAEYYERLQAVRMHGRWEEWVEFFFRGARDVATEATDTARKILALRETHRAKLHAEGRASSNLLRALDLLFESPICTVNLVAHQLEVTYRTANLLVERLEALEVLEEMTGQARNRRFRYAPYLNLFSEDQR